MAETKKKRINSKKKGSHGELELSNTLKEYGFETRRSQQFCGRGDDSADIVGMANIHIECKRVENLNIDQALGQAIDDVSFKSFTCKDEEEIPVVMHRKNKKPWKVTLLLEDFITIYKGWQDGKKEI